MSVIRIAIIGETTCEDVPEPSDLVYSKKSRGPRTEPWGTPIVRVCGADIDPLQVTW